MQVPQIAASSFNKTPVSPEVKGQLSKIRELGMNGATDDVVKMECHQLLQKPAAKNEGAIIALVEVGIELESEGKSGAAEAIYSRVDSATGNREAHQRYECLVGIRMGLHSSFEVIMPMLQETGNQEDRPMAAFFCGQKLIENAKRTYKDVDMAIGYFEKALKESHPSAKAALINARGILESMALVKGSSDNAVHSAQNLVVVDQHTIRNVAILARKAVVDKFVPDIFKKK